ncbi:hypothetical protein G7084_05830 [Weissella coleopterorum]|uniref:Uncharacterized protein n=1 Tax=Weissella coleopterorum TaxID=2714949 RepID=A0A6G8B0W0_9LACO|nr:hypothetical protein [Weissella coleopterorum]QIL50877.1 hypothetical protein G7084_05830 [Weissella coleopterorum]
MHNFKSLVGGLKDSNTIALVKFYLFLEINQRCSWENVVRFVQTLPWHDFGCMSVNQVQLIWIRQVLEEWEKLEIVKFETGQLVMLKPVIWYENLEHKRRDWCDVSQRF